MGSFTVKRNGHGLDRTGENVSAVTVLGGKIVIPSTNAAVSDPSLIGFGLATDAAVNVIGVTGQDTVPLANRAALENGTASWDSGVPTFDASVPGATTVIYDDAEGQVTYTGACGQDAAICASSTTGAVRAWVQGTDVPAARIGRCTQPGGMSGAGVGLAHIRVS